ncbi:hypothetical protein M0805_001930 [Coniferiporia weirii]|nr:hypothetical protein M0805_001930 [Coniferiporia weirii]
MHLHDDLLFARDCVQCPSQAPGCDCGIGFQCITTARSCSACPATSCVAGSDGNSSSGGSGVSGGAIAGGVIGALIFLSASVALLVWYRRRQRVNTDSTPQVDAKPDVPARAEAVLSRPDPVEKPRSPSPQEPESVRMYSVMSDSTINLDPQAKHSGPSSRPSARGSMQSNPFTDTHSIQTTSASTQSTNVIPIALVPHGSASSSPHSLSSDKLSNASSIPPVRPTHTPELGLRFDPLSSSLNLEHVNLSKDSFRPPNMPYANSQASGFTGISSRDSVMTSGSFASDMLYEAPQIVTNGGAMRQVLGVAKAEVISVPGSIPSTPMSSNSLKPSMSSRAVRPPARSPLAQASFRPTDSSIEFDMTGQDIEYPSHDPFNDEHTPGIHTGNSTSTFGIPTPVPLPSTASPHYNTYLEREQHASSSARPASTYTQAASIIGAEIGGATVVRLGSASSMGISSMNQKRMTSAKLVSPSSAPLRLEDDRALQEQQAQALAVARARAAASGLPPSNPRRVSGVSVASAGGDSLLENFTFVPPSPISNRPPRSPLGQQTMFSRPQQLKDERQLSTPSPRQMQGMSTSSSSSALEGYTFHIDQAPPMPPVPDFTMQSQASAQGASSASNTKSPPSSMGGKHSTRQRASLDTLALTADLSAFPLNFDEGRGSFSVSR